MRKLTKEDVYKGFLILVNADYPMRASNDENSLAPVGSAGHEVLLIGTAAALLQMAMKRLSCEMEIAAVSGFRSRQEQKAIYLDSLRENGREFTEKYVALPGHSEHQTGLAVDMALAGQDIDPLTPDFPYDGVCQKFRDAIARYGFIERYPQGKEHITRIGHEPWHFRYVGVPHATMIRQSGLSLEEYITMLRGYPFNGERLRFSRCGRAYEIGFMEAENGIAEMAATDRPYRISGNNVDGFIITKWC